jgi:hypothetical protein
MEDPSSIWYDNLDQIKRDYQEMKEIYDIINVFDSENIQTALENNP